MYQVKEFLLTLLFFTTATTLSIGTVVGFFALIIPLGPIGFVIVLLALLIIAISAVWIREFDANPFTVLFSKDK